MASILAIERFVPPYRYDQTEVVPWVREWLNEGEAAAAARLTTTHTRLDPDRALLLAEEGTIPGPDGGRVWRHDERTWHWIASVDHGALEERWAAITVPTLAVTGAEAWDTWWARPGGPVADATFATLGPRVEKLRANGHNPGLGTILVGADPARRGRAGAPPPVHACARRPAPVPSPHRTGCDRGETGC